MASLLRKVTEPDHPTTSYQKSYGDSHPASDRGMMAKIKDKLTGHEGQGHDTYRGSEYATDVGRGTTLGTGVAGSTAAGSSASLGHTGDDRGMMAKIKDKLTGHEGQGQGREVFHGAEYTDASRGTTLGTGTSLRYEAGGRDYPLTTGSIEAERVLEGDRGYEQRQIYESGKTLETGFARCPETYEVGAARVHGERLQEKVEKVEVVDEGAQAARAEMIQPFKRERVIVSHLEPHTDKVERFTTHYETVEKIVPVSVPTEKVTMQEVEETLNVMVRLQEPRIERLDKTVNVSVETEVVRIVEVEKNVTVTVKVREPRVEKVVKTVPATISSEVVRMVEVEKSIPVRIKKLVPKVQQLSQTAEARIRVEKPVVDRVEEPRQHMVKVYETHERLVPAGPMKMSAGYAEDASRLLLSAADRDRDAAFADKGTASGYGTTSGSYGSRTTAGSYGTTGGTTSTAGSYGTTAGTGSQASKTSGAGYGSSGSSAQSQIGQGTQNLRR